jgi:hypothetical protein
MRLILTGATGLVGSAALNHLLTTSLPAGEVSALYILSRSPVPMAENKPNVTVIKHKNFNEYPAELLEKLKGADGCIWAQGISQAQVSKEYGSIIPRTDYGRFCEELRVLTQITGNISKSHSTTRSQPHRPLRVYPTRSISSTSLARAYVFFLLPPTNHPLTINRQRKPPPA